MTYEEFQAGLAETPELLGTVLEKHEVDAVKYLTDGKKMVVTTMEEYTNNTQKAVDLATKQNHTAWEEKLEKLTGQKLPQGKKGLAWFDELAANLKYVTEQGDDANAAIIKGLQKELKDLKTDLSTKDQQVLQARIDAEVTTAVKGLQFATPAHLKKDAEKSAYQTQKADDALDIFNSRYKTSVDANGRFVFTNKKGEAQTANGEPMTAEAIEARDFANDLAPKGHKQGGAGSEDNDPGNNNANPDYLGDTTEAIRTKLSEMMLKVGTDAWADKYNKAHLAAGYVKQNDVYVKKS